MPQAARLAAVTLLTAGASAAYAPLTLPNPAVLRAPCITASASPLPPSQLPLAPAEAPRSSAPPSPLRLHRRHLLSLCGALTSIVCAEAVVAQALPLALAQEIGSNIEVSEALARITSFGAAIDFAMLPVLGSFSDVSGRRPLLLALPLLALCLRLVAIVSPTLTAVVLSRMCMGSIVSCYFLLVGTSCADLFQDDSASLAALEGRSAACWGVAYALGMGLGGQLLCGGIASAGILRRTYGASAVLAAMSFACALFGTRETLPAEARLPFSKRRLARESTPGGFFSLFTRKGEDGRRLALLSTILGLHALHDGEGDVWQARAVKRAVYSVEMRGWGTQANAAYGGSVGVASTVGGLLTGASVQLLGPKWHTALTTVATACANLLFMSRSSVLAFGSVLFAASEDCMSAAVMARIMKVGDASGIGRGRTASDCHNLAAIVRVVGLYGFGKLFAIGVRIGRPQLPYLVLAASQLLAVALVLGAGRRLWHDADDDGPACQGEPHAE